MEQNKRNFHASTALKYNAKHNFSQNITHSVGFSNGVYTAGVIGEFKFGLYKSNADTLHASQDEFKRTLFPTRDYSSKLLTLNENVTSCRYIMSRNMSTNF
jgi:hypothetical protein